ncbi:hypothetical protein AA13595_0555 [Gluconacetobacter johannae DSM 13595]|nr:hypothetical protein AA13595_0555 [Gluconacetobacter johannae DSM 13595]
MVARMAALEITSACGGSARFIWGMGSVIGNSTKSLPHRQHQPAPPDLPEQAWEMGIDAELPGKAGLPDA